MLRHSSTATPYPELTMPRRPRDNQRLKILLAQECARILMEESAQDFRTAKRKAALRLGVDDRAALPDNSEIELALVERQRLFHAKSQAECLRSLRETALDAMRFLARFRPRLVGPVLSGVANPNTGIQLHLFVDAPEEIALFLLDQHIPFEAKENRLKMANGEPVCLPAFRLRMGQTRIDLTVFTPLAEREAPLSSIHGRPMRRARLAEVEALLSGSPP